MNVSQPPLQAQASTAAPTLRPVFFFHGIFLNADSGANFATKMAQEARHFVPLSFCSNQDSTRTLNDQVQLAITQIRGIVNNDTRFDNGYNFIAFSQGGMVARAVIEEMDDHKVKTFISLAAVMNGLFLGPQPEDQRTLKMFLTHMAPAFVPSTVFDFSKYTENGEEADAHGKFQSDLDIFVQAHPELQNQFSFFNLLRSPVAHSWKASNAFLAEINNVNVGVQQTGSGEHKQLQRDQLRRRGNFLKLHAAHFFGSPDDGAIAPWQTSILGQYSEVSDVEDIVNNFDSLHVLGMKDTAEYQEDTYGLKTLDTRGGLFLHTVPGVAHVSWITDSDEFGPNLGTTTFSELYENHIRVLL